MVAYLICEDTATLTINGLDEFCMSSMARFKRPREYRLVNGLPKNSYGKVLQTAIRQVETTLQAGVNKLLDLEEV